MGIKNGLYDAIQIIGTNPVVAAISPDHAGFNISAVSGTKRINSAGQHGAVKTFPIGVKFSGTLNFTLDSTTVPLFALMIPVAPTVPPPAKIYPKFTVDDGEYIYSCQSSGGKFDINLDNEVVFSVDIIATARTASTTVITITPMVDPWISNHIVLTGFPTGKSTEGISIAIANGLKEVYGMDGATRTPQHLAEGYHNIDLDFKFNENPGVDVAADDLATVAAATIVMLTVSGAAGGHLDLTNILAGDNPKDSKPEDIERFGLKYTADAITLTAATS